ncbi:hypothetical protein ACIBI0_38775 [Microbispora rosea]|uniref:hypothetical protein n=1 Tax=Microbispora rosea TaxID=58117 RepID=UPI00379A3414
MTRHLDQLPGLHEDVVESMPAGGSGTGPAVSGTREPRLPVNLDAGDQASQIDKDVRYIVGLVTSERGLAGPQRADVASRCAWLAEHVEWLAASDYAAEVRAVLAELVSGALRVISPIRKPIALGPCIQTVEDLACEGTLQANITNVDGRHPARIWCTHCGFEANTSHWFRFGEDWREHMRGVATTAVG